MRFGLVRYRDKVQGCPVASVVRGALLALGNDMVVGMCGEVRVGEMPG